MMHRRDGWGHEYPKLLRGVWDSNVTASSRPCPHQKKKTRRNYRRCRRQRYAAKLYGYMDYNPFAQVQDSTSGTNPCALLIHTATAKRRRTATPPHLHTLTASEGLRRSVSFIWVPLPYILSGHFFLRSSRNSRASSFHPTPYRCRSTRSWQCV